MKRCKKLLAVLLTMACMMTMSVSAFAAEPVEAPVGNSETALPTAVSPRSIYGYAAKYTNPLSGSFTVDSPGSGNSSGTLQITLHDFPGNPTVNVVLYRPDGTYATEFSITGNTTKSKSFSYAIAGTYTVYYSVQGSYAGWISAWVSS